MHPTVAVIIPTFRRPEFLAEALDSVARQTWPGPVEILVVDNDADPAVAALLAARYPAVRYFARENAGPAAAREFAATQTSAALLAYLDDDDLWLPEKLERCVDVLRHHLEVDFVFHDGRRFNLEGDFGLPIHERSAELHDCPRSALTGLPHTFKYAPRVLTDCFVHGIPINTCSIVARREFMQRIGGWDATIRGNGETHDFSFRATWFGTPAFIAEPLMRIRRYHAERLTGDKLATLAEECEVMLRVTEQYPHDLRAHLRRPLALHLATVAWQFNDAGQRRAAHRWYGLALHQGNLAPRTLMRWLQTSFG